VKHAETPRENRPNQKAFCFGFIPTFSSDDALFYEEIYRNLGLNQIQVAVMSGAMKFFRSFAGATQVLFLPLLTACTRTPAVETSHEPAAASALASEAPSRPNASAINSAARPETLVPSTASAAKTTPHLVSYTATGRVKSLDTATRLINIAHDDIPGYMNAMTMPFEAATPQQTGEVKTGDKVKFSFTDDGNGKRVLQTIKRE